MVFADDRASILRQAILKLYVDSNISILSQH